MEKTIKLTQERVNFLNDYLEKTKEAKDQVTLANREKVANTLSDFKDLAEITKSIVKAPTYEKAEKLTELIKLTIDELISHNEKALNGHKQMLQSLSKKIEEKPSESAAEKSIIEEFKNVHTQLNSYVKQCLAVKDELNVIIEKAVNDTEEIDGVPVMDLDGVTSLETTPIEEVKKEETRHWDDEDLWEATQLENVDDKEDNKEEEQEEQQEEEENINEKYEQENKKEDDTNEFPI